MLTNNNSNDCESFSLPMASRKNKIFVYSCAVLFLSAVFMYSHIPQAPNKFPHRDISKTPRLQKLKDEEKRPPPISGSSCTTNKKPNSRLKTEVQESNDLNHLYGANSKGQKRKRFPRTEIHKTSNCNSKAPELKKSSTKDKEKRSPPILGASCTSKTKPNTRLGTEVQKSGDLNNCNGANSKEQKRKKFPRTESYKTSNCISKAQKLKKSSTKKVSHYERTDNCIYNKYDDFIRILKCKKEKFKKISNDFKFWIGLGGTEKQEKDKKAEIEFDEYDYDYIKYFSDTRKSDQRNDQKDEQKDVLKYERKCEQKHHRKDEHYEKKNDEKKEEQKFICSPVIVSKIEKKIEQNNEPKYERKCEQKDQRKYEQYKKKNDEQKIISRPVLVSKIEKQIDTLLRNHARALRIVFVEEILRVKKKLGTKDEEILRKLEDDEGYKVLIDWLNDEGIDWVEVIGKFDHKSELVKSTNDHYSAQFQDELSIVNKKDFMEIIKELDKRIDKYAPVGPRGKLKKITNYDSLTNVKNHIKLIKNRVDALLFKHSKFVQYDMYKELRKFYQK